AAGGADGVLEPQPPGGVAQGRDLGRGADRAQRPLRLRRRHPAVPRRPAGRWRLPHRQPHVLLPGLRARGRLSGAVVRPSLDEFRSLARTHTVIPVWRELLADLTTPVSAYLRLVGDGTGFLLESVEHGESRWSRWSFVGRNPLATLTARGLDVQVVGTVPPTVPCDRGILAALDALLAAWHAPSLPDLPPLHGGVLGYLGYDVVREVEHLPDVPADDLGHPDAVVSVIGQLAAYDHWRQRAVLVENVLVPPGSSDDELDVLYDEAVARLDQLARDGARPIDEPLVAPPHPNDPLPEVRSTMGPERFQEAVEVARERILAGDLFQVV